MTGRVEGKVALIVGAGCVGPGWGNGRAAAVLFAREGAKVFAVDKNADSMTETLERAGNDGEIATHVCDVLDDAQVAAMTETCRKRFGRIEILVNNVGGSAAGGVAEMSEDNFDRQIDYNLKSVFLTCRHVIPVMVAQGGGAIVNITSISGLRASTLRTAYGTSKAGLAHLTQQQAIELAPLGIRVNAVAPGVVETDMSNFARTDAGRDFTLGMQALKRVAQPDDIGDVVAFLASADARWVNGDTVRVDGGSKL